MMKSSNSIQDTSWRNVWRHPVKVDEGSKQYPYNVYSQPTLFGSPQSNLNISITVF